MTTRLHPLFLFAAATLLASCRYLPGRPGDGGGDASGRPGGALSNERPSTSQGRADSGRAAGDAAHQPEAAARPAAPPRARVLVVPEGTHLPLELESAVSSGTSRREDLVVARLTEDVRVGQRVVLPEGSEVRGRVTAAVPSGRVKGRARLAVAFDSVEVDGRRHDIEATKIDITAGSTTKRDAALIGGGALVGAVVKGKKGAGIGALLGGGAVLVTKGKEVTLPAGTPIRLTLKRDLKLE